MSDESRMNTTPSLFRRLQNTPLRDLVRGRVSGTLDAKAVIAASGLPKELALIVRRVTRGTRLSRVERVEVAHELVDHFLDGMAEGISAPRLMEAFGDERVTAKLIRRSMQRKRSVFARGVRQTVRAGVLCVGMVIVFYLLLAIKHRNREIRITVDYVAMLNAPTLASEPEDRSWPEIRAAITTLRGLAGPPPEESMHVDQELSRFAAASMSARPAPWIDAELGPPALPFDDEDVDAARVDQFFVAAQPALERLRAAANRPLLGFSLVASGLQDPADRVFFGEEVQNLDAVSEEGDANEFQDSVLMLKFQYFASVRLAARLLAADARRAAVEGDGPRMVADVSAILGLAGQTRTPSIMIAQLVGMSMERLAFTVVLDSIAALPKNIDDHSILALAEMVRGLDDERLGLVMTDERRFFLDFAQRVYTDDGNGDGAFSIGSQVVGMIGASGDDFQPMFFESGAGEFLLGPLVAELTIGRADAVRLWMQAMDSVEEQSAKPPWEFEVAALGMVNERSQKSITDYWTSKIGYFPRNVMMPATEGIALAGAAIRLERDLVLTVLQLEAARRREGAWPQSLDELEFTDGGEPARDPFDGSTVRYLRRDGRPLIYILGPDRDDDGGRRIEQARPGIGGWRDLQRGGLAGSSRRWGIGREPADSEPDGDIAVWASGGE